MRGSVGSGAACDPGATQSSPLLSHFRHQVLHFCCSVAFSAVQVAMDMGNDEVGEAEDLMEAYWLQAGVAFLTVAFLARQDTCLQAGVALQSMPYTHSERPYGAATAEAATVQHAWTHNSPCDFAPLPTAAAPGLPPLPPQVDSSLSRLKILQERISNTEHLVNLDLDSKRNALVGAAVLGARCQTDTIPECAQESACNAALPCPCPAPALPCCPLLPCRVQVALGLAVDLLLMMFEVHMAVTGGAAAGQVAVISVLVPACLRMRACLPCLPAASAAQCLAATSAPDPAALPRINHRLP